MSGEASPRHVTKFCRAAPHVTNTIEPPCMSHVTLFSRHVFFIYFLLTTPLFFLSQRNLSFLHTMLVTRREKLFVLCTLRPPLPNWGLTRPPNMPKVSPVAHDDGLCTEDAPTGSPQIGAPPTPLRWFWRGDDVAASSAAGACCCRR